MQQPAKLRLPALMRPVVFLLCETIDDLTPFDPTAFIDLLLEDALLEDATARSGS